MCVFLFRCIRNPFDLLEKNVYTECVFFILKSVYTQTLCFLEKGYTPMVPEKTKKKSAGRKKNSVYTVFGVYVFLPGLARLGWTGLAIGWAELAWPGLSRLGWAGLVGLAGQLAWLAGWLTWLGGLAALAGLAWPA